VPLHHPRPVPDDPVGEGQGWSMMFVIMRKKTVVQGQLCSLLY
jgi:hypothetical protein